jgi:YfiR/HmsC-like
MSKVARASNNGRTYARPLQWIGRWAGSFGLLFLFCLQGPASGQELVTENPRKVEAAFLRNFARYVTWPADAFSGERSPWNICILGGDPFGDVLEKTFRGRTEQGRSFAIIRADALDELPACQIVFIAHQDAAERRAALNELKRRPVLTVGDAPGFLREGGILRFQVSDHVEMSINLDQARSVSLTIQTKMLEVSREILENGTMRRWK